MIYWPLYGPTLGGHAEQQADHADHGTSPWVITGLIVLVTAQAFDIWQQRRSRARNVAARTD